MNCENMNSMDEFYDLVQENMNDFYEGVEERRKEARKQKIIFQIVSVGIFVVFLLGMLKIISL